MTETTEITKAEKILKAGYNQHTTPNIDRTPTIDPNNSLKNLP